MQAISDFKLWNDDCLIEKQRFKENVKFNFVPLNEFNTLMLFGEKKQIQIITNTKMTELAVLFAVLFKVFKN